ncbi:ArsR family transcriptional regulator [Candidatus Bathyarchaeota archaeon]|nr:ArsR family transcriptional regulator [Candidatus Bathyarchaeota archaeon]
MPDSEEEIYSIMFSSLKHPARRKILRMLAEKPMTFSQMLEAIGVSSSHLTYHLENLGELLSKADNGKYRLSTFGEAAVNTMKIVEEAPAVRSRYGLPLSLRWRSILAVLIIAVVLLASFSYVQYASLSQLSDDNKLLQSRYDQLLSWSASTDDAIAFLQNVIQLDTGEYQATLLRDTMEQRSDLGGVAEEILSYSLTNSESQIDVILRFRNQKLSQYRALFEGSPFYSQPQPYTLLDAARGVLERLNSFEDTAYLQKMLEMLDQVEETENAEVVEDNVKLTASISGRNAELIWQYTENGVDFSPKSLSLIFESGVLKELSDGWFLFTIETATVTVSTEQQAIAIARNAVEGFTWTVDSVKVSGFTVLEEPVLAVFHPTLRSGDLALVPYWEVTLYLDKVYTGGVNRIGVGVWADNGEVRRIRTLSG